MTPYSAPRPAMAPCGAPRTRGHGPCQRLTPEGRPCRYHQPGLLPDAHLWIPAFIQELGTLLERGMTDREAGSRLGVTVPAIANARRRYGVARRDELLMTTVQVAEVLGCASHTVVAWARRRWIPGLHRRGRGGHTQWLFSQKQLMRFLEDARYRHLWEPETIPDARLRTWATKLRGNVRNLTYDEAAARIGCSRWTIQHYVRTGKLTNYRRSYALVREDEVLALARPAHRRVAA